MVFNQFKRLFCVLLGFGVTTTGLVAIRKAPCMWTSSSYWAFEMAQVAEKVLGLESVRPRLIRAAHPDPG